MKLTLAQISEFEKNGYLVVEGMLTESHVAALRQRTEDIASGRVDFPANCIEFEPGSEDGRDIRSLRKINRGATYDPVISEHARNPALLDAIECLLGPDIKLFHDQLFVKPPGGVEKTYHQDSPYFYIEPMALVTAWVALDDVTLENGCMWVIPGSHRGGPLDHSEPWFVGDRQDMRIPDSAIDLSNEQPITMTAGGCSFHHSLTLHRSGPNNSPDFRRGHATHYMTARSRWTGEPADKPNYPLLRGVEHPNCV